MGYTYANTFSCEHYLELNSPERVHNNIMISAENSRKIGWKNDMQLLLKFISKAETARMNIISNTDFLDIFCGPLWIPSWGWYKTTFMIYDKYISPKTR